MRIRYSLMISIVLLVFCTGAFPATPPLSTKDFEGLGAGAMIGQIFSVTLTYGSPFYETGMVEILPIQILSGEASTKTIQLPFTRALVLAESPSNWDLVGSSGVSLTKQVGLQLLIFYSENDDVLSLFPASNAVQNAEDSLVLGTVDDVYGVNRDGRASGHSIQVKINVNENIFGWVDGTSITVPVADADERRKTERSYSELAEIGRGISYDDVIALCHRGHHGARQIIFSIVGGKIQGAFFPNKSFLDTLKLLDTE